MSPRTSSQSNNNNDDDDEIPRRTSRTTRTTELVTAADAPSSRSGAAAAVGNAGDGHANGEPLAAFSSGSVSTSNGILTLSWGLDALPHKLKVRKVMHWWPLRLKVGGEYDLKEKDFKATAECHDAVLGGEFSFDVMHSSVEYAKRFDLGGVSQLALKGRCNLGDGRERWDASFGFVIEPKASAGPLGVSTHVSNTTKGYDVVTEIPVSKLVSAELCGHLSLPLPVAVGFTRVSSTLKTSLTGASRGHYAAEFTAHTRGGGRLTVGRHGNVTAHVAQINAIVNL